MNNNLAILPSHDRYISAMSHMSTDIGDTSQDYKDKKLGYNWIKNKKYKE